METYLDYQVEDVADASNAHMKPARTVWYVSLEERHLMKELILGSKGRTALPYLQRASMAIIGITLGLGDL